ncbi:hypothetical protein Dimus_005922 [Dionaea muscipula]
MTPGKWEAPHHWLQQARIHSWEVTQALVEAIGAKVVDRFLAEENMNVEECKLMNLAIDSYGSFTLPINVDEPPTPGASSPTTSKDGRKRGRVSDDVAKSISEMVDTFGSFFQKTDARLADIAKGINYEQDGRKARKNLNDELTRLVLDLDDRMTVLLSISKSDTLVDIFFSLKTEEDRMCFIQRIYLM